MRKYSVGNKQTAMPVRLGYRIDGKEYWIANDRFDLTAEQVLQPINSVGILKSSSVGGSVISMFITLLIVASMVL